MRNKTENQIKNNIESYIVDTDEIGMTTMNDNIKN